MLKVRLLSEGAKAPTVANPKEDLGYDLYSLHDRLIITSGVVYKVHTGVAVEASNNGIPLGLIIKDRSSLASKGVFTHGGVIDSGYRGEIVVLMTLLHDNAGYIIKKGDKIAQMVPVQVLTGAVEVVDELSEAARGDRGFGSSGA